jgi:cytochrome c oxidase subunit 2
MFSSYWPSVLAILPGNLGLGDNFLALSFLILSILVFVALGAIYWSNKHPIDTGYHEAKGWLKHEKTYTIAFFAIVIVFASSTLGLLPYPYAHAGIKPDMTINVRAQQFQWCLSYAPSWGTNCQTTIKIPVGNTVLFNTSSIDVNHGFGIYSGDGALLDQVQVMPGFYNNIIYQFTSPGTYYIRCMEFCGYGHFGMVSQVNVTGS